MLKEKRDAEKKARQPKPNVKTAEINPAKIGAEQDARGVRYSHEKSVKKFLGDRKRQMDNIDKQANEDNGSGEKK